MRYMLMMHAPRGTGDWHFMHRLNQELTEAGELVGAEGLAPRGEARVAGGEGIPRRLLDRRGRPGGASVRDRGQGLGGTTSAPLCTTEPRRNEPRASRSGTILPRRLLGSAPSSEPIRPMPSHAIRPSLAVALALGLGACGSSTEPCRVESLQVRMPATGRARCAPGEHRGLCQTGPARPAQRRGRGRCSER